MESRITKALENRIKSEEENCYYGRYFYQILGQIMIDVFLVKIEKDTLFEEIYELFLQYRLEIARKIAEMLKEYNILYSYVNVFLVWEQEWERKMNKREPEYSDDEVEMIRKLLLIYLNKDILGDEDGIPSEEKLRLDDLLGIVKNIFKECYADCMAKQLLNLPFADFIYSFLADAWNEKISDIRLGHQKKGIWSGRFMKVHPVGHIIDFA